MKYRAVEVYFPHGWKAQIWVELHGCFVTIQSSPVTKTPEQAIQWAQHNWN